METINFPKQSVLSKLSMRFKLCAIGLHNWFWVTTDTWHDDGRIEINSEKPYWECRWCKSRKRKAQ